jgi:hypothetical protein
MTDRLVQCAGCCRHIFMNEAWWRIGAAMGAAGQEVRAQVRGLGASRSPRIGTRADHGPLACAPARRRAGSLDAGPQPCLLTCDTAPARPQRTRPCPRPRPFSHPTRAECLAPRTRSHDSRRVRAPLPLPRGSTALTGARRQPRARCGLLHAPTHGAHCSAALPDRPLQHDASRTQAGVRAAGAGSGRAPTARSVAHHGPRAALTATPRCSS